MLVENVVSIESVVARERNPTAKESMRRLLVSGRQPLHWPLPRVEDRVQIDATPGRTCVHLDAVPRRERTRLLIRKTSG